MPPRRWWQAIMAPQTICYIIYNQDNTHQTTAGAQPRTASGVRFRWSVLTRPACRHDPAWRNTGLRTAATTSGVAEMLASGHRLRLGRRGGRCAIGGTWSTATGMGCGRGLWKDCAPAGKPRGGVPERNDPALTQLCRGCGVPPTTVCRRYAPVAQWSVKARLKSGKCRGMQIQGTMAS